MYKSLLLFPAICIASLCLARAAEPLQLDGITEPFRDVTLGLAEPGIIHQQFFQEGAPVSVVGHPRGPPKPACP